MIGRLVKLNILNDFFFLAWQKEPISISVDSNDFFLTLLLKNYADFCDFASVILITSSSNFSELSQIQEPKDAITFFIASDDWDKATVQGVQCRLLSFLSFHGDMVLNKDISKRLDMLRKSSVIGYETSRRLISILSLIKEKRKAKEIVVAKESIEGDSFYESGVLILREQVKTLAESIEDKELLLRVNAVPVKLDNQKFSIGITGVMNAGKSTMLNALLGSEVLGTSVVPETANLTIIKYASEPKASVNFWSEREWSSIERSAESLESMKNFVSETREHFDDDFASYVTGEGRSIDISIEALPSYTSAKHSDKKCNLVKSVELYSDLEFVKNGVEIVDTPGLDDPVIQREEITKTYLMDCDLLCHLMNVGQSATQKDIDFIVDSLLYSSVAQLLVVITRIDTVSTQDLEEVIAYTKRSIKSKLESLDKTAQFDSIIERIDFIPIAGKMALLHRTGKGDEALALGYSLEKSGIGDIEEYLRVVLFGDDSQKARLIIEASIKELGMLIKAQIDAYEIEQGMLGKDSDEIAQEYERYQEQISGIKSNMLRLDERIADSRDELVDYFSVLSNFASNKLKSLQSLLKRRVFDDVSYELRKNKRKPTAERIAAIIETGMKDGFIDLLRDYRYQFQRKVDGALEKIDSDFEGFSIENDNSIHNSKEFFEKHFSILNLVNSNLLLIENINSDIKSHNKKEMQALDMSLENHFQLAIDELHSKFKDKADIVHHELVGDFERRCKAPLERIEFEISSREGILTEASDRAKDKSFDHSRRAKDIDNKVKVIKVTKETIEELMTNSIGGVK